MPVYYGGSLCNGTSNHGRGDVCEDRENPWESERREITADGIVTILLSPLGGILADRANRRNIMVALDTLTGVSVLCAAVVLSENHALMVIGALLVALSVFGAFETPTVQACIPQMLAGDNIIRGNAVVNQVASISYLTAPLLGGVV